MARRCPDRFTRSLPLALALLIGLVILGDRAVAAADPAPAFAARQLGSNQMLDLAALRGSVVLLNTWATWCYPCRQEMPYLERLQQTYGGQGFRVVGVNIDEGDADDRVREFADTIEVSFTLLRDPENRFAQVFRTRGVPETLLLGRDGTVLYHWRGALREDAPDDLARIEGALSGTDAAASSSVVATIALPLAFAAGLLSFLSPCVLPLVPAYAAVITGLSLEELRAVGEDTRRATRRAVLTRGVLFVVGFGLVFILLGASLSALSSVLYDWREGIARLGGVILTVLGLHLLGVWRIPLLDRTARFDVSDRAANPSAGYASAFIVGLAFGAGWTPCIGATLAAILAVAAANASLGEGIALLTVYALGLAVPFLLAAAALDRFLQQSARLRPWLPRLQQLSGVLVLLVAALLLTNAMTRLADFVARWQS